MNVEWRCRFEYEVPDLDGELVKRRCGTRIMALASGTNLKCRLHPDAGLENVEEQRGPDFLNVEEGGRTRSKDTILLDSEGNPTIRVVPEPKIDRDAPPNPTLVMEQTVWREAYLAAVGESADLRWGVPRIQEELQAYKREQESRQEYEGQTPAPDDSANGAAETSENPEAVEHGAGVIVSEIPPEQEGNTDGNSD